MPLPCVPHLFVTLCHIPAAFPLSNFLLRSLLFLLRILESALPHLYWKASRGLFIYGVVHIVHLFKICCPLLLLVHPQLFAAACLSFTVDISNSVQPILHFSSHFHLSSCFCLFFPIHLSGPSIVLSSWTRLFLCILLQLLTPVTQQQNFIHYPRWFLHFGFVAQY